MNKKTSNAIRKAASRLAMRQAGLRPVEIWALPEHHAVIKEYARQLRETDLAVSDDIADDDEFEAIYVTADGRMYGRSQGIDRAYPAEFASVELVPASDKNRGTKK